MQKKSLLFLFVTLMLWACKPVQYPAITESPTEDYRYHEFVWHELGTANMTRASQFYSDLFGWEISEVSRADRDYRIITNNGKPIGGIIRIANGQKNQWVGVLSVEDATAKMNDATTNGANALVGTTSIPGRGTMAIMKDGQGAVYGIMHSQSGDPPRSRNENEWLWMELWSDNVDESVQHYQHTFGYEITEREDDGKPYWVMTTDDVPAMGVTKNPAENMTTQWIPYIKVSDPAAMAGRVRALGGDVILQPRDDIRNGTVAVVTDQDGAIFCLQKWDQ